MGGDPTCWSTRLDRVGPPAHPAHHSAPRSLVHLVCVVGNSCCVGCHEPHNTTVLRKEFWPPLPVILPCDLREVPCSTSLGVPNWKMGMLASEGFWVSCVRREAFAPVLRRSLLPASCPSPAGRSGAGGDAGSHDRIGPLPIRSLALKL